MRKQALIALIIVLCSSFLFSTKAQSQQTCSDSAYLDRYSADLQKMTDELNRAQTLKFDADSLPVTKGELAFYLEHTITIRHDYEDATVPDGCLKLNNFAIQFLTSIKGLYSLSLLNAIDSGNSN